MSELKPKNPKSLDQTVFDELYRTYGILDEKHDPRKQEPFGSKVAFFGPLIIGIKKGVRILISPIVNMIFLKQANFNENLLKLISRLLKHHHEEYCKIYENETNIDFLIKYIKRLQDDNISLNTRINQLSDTEKKISKQKIMDTTTEKQFVTKINNSINKEKNSLWDNRSFQFQNRFRGLDGEIKKAQEVYLPFFKDSQNILDVGCGRGEFLTLLKENKISAVGIDLDEYMVQFCQNKDLNAKKADAFEYLKLLKDRSLGGIIATHIVEHFSSCELKEFIQLCSVKLKSGANLIIETPNPESVIVSSTNFYLDLDHTNPVHPEVLKFLLESYGFTKNEVNYLSPFNMERQLNKIYLSSKLFNREIIKQINQNFEHLNQVLYGFQDYSVIGKIP